MSANCFKCGKPIAESNFGRRDSCESCGGDTRVCRNCKNYDRTKNNECREEQAPRIVEKERANFCEWFQPGGAGGAISPNSNKDALKSAAESLFKKK
jgi:hypothetical protein